MIAITEVWEVRSEKKRRAGVFMKWTKAYSKASVREWTTNWFHLGFIFWAPSWLALKLTFALPTSSLRRNCFYLAYTSSYLVSILEEPPCMRKTLKFDFITSFQITINLSPWQLILSAVLILKSSTSELLFRMFASLLRLWAFDIKQWLSSNSSEVSRFVSVLDQLLVTMTQWGTSGIFDSLLEFVSSVTGKLSVKGKRGPDR